MSLPRRKSVLGQRSRNLRQNYVNYMNRTANAGTQNLDRRRNFQKPAAPWHSDPPGLTRRNIKRAVRGFRFDIFDPQLVFQKKNKVWEGSQGEVWNITVHGQIHGVRIINVGVHIDEIKRGLAIQSLFSHRNIVSLMGKILDKRNQCLWCTFLRIDGVPLSIICHRRNEWKEELISYVCREVLLGLQHLHASQIIHRNISSESIFVSLEGGIKISNFEYAVESYNNYENKMVGSPHWMAPEQIRGVDYDEKADIWSLGIVALEMCDGQPPFASEPPLKCMEMITIHPAPGPKDPTKWSKIFREFLSAALEKDRMKRAESNVLVLYDPFILRGDNFDTDLFAIFATECIRSNGTSKLPQGKEDFDDIFVDPDITEEWIYTYYAGDI